MTFEFLFLIMCSLFLVLCHLARKIRLERPQDDGINVLGGKSSYELRTMVDMSEEDLDRLVNAKDGEFVAIDDPEVVIEHKVFDPALPPVEGIKVSKVDNPDDFNYLPVFQGDMPDQWAERGEE